jgi:hypothetical protein
MSAFRTGVFTVELAERLGIGVTLNADGSIASVDGPTLRRTVAVPADVDNAGSLALRTNGSLYVATGAGVWIPIGGAAGWLLIDDATGIWGTAAPGQVTSVYVSAANRWDLSGDAITGAVAASGAAMRVETGNNTITGGVAGNASGLIEVRTGITDSTNAGGTAGNSGAVSITSGNSTSTLGVSGTTGNISLITGNSDDAASGSVILTTGTAGGARGVIDVNAPTIDCATQAVQILGIDANAVSIQIGATGAPNMLVFDTTNAAEEITLNAVGAGINGINGIRAIDNIAYATGTAVNDRFRFQYASVGTTGQILGTSITAGGAAQATRPLLIETGARTKNDADAGVPTSGAITVRSGTTSQTTAAAIGGISGAAILASGSTDVTFAAATGGASGAVTVQSGNTDISAAVAATGGATGNVVVRSGDALSTGVGATSAASGTLGLSTGTSADAGTGGLTLESGAALGAAGNTGGLTIRSGAATGAGGGVTSGGVVVSSGAVGGTGTTGTISFTTGNPAGAGTSGPITSTTGTTTGAAGTGLISLTTGGTGTGTTGAVNIVTGNTTGVGTSGNINLTPGTTVGGTRGQTVALGLRTTSTTAGAIVGATALTLADSGGIFSVSQGANYDIDLPNPTVGAGLRFVFYLTAPGAFNPTITVLGGAATFVGTIVNDVTSVIPATGATLTFASGFSALGDNIEIISISTTLYLVRAVTSTAGGITIA